MALGVILVLYVLCLIAVYPPLAIYIFKKKHASRHHPERRPRDGFDWNPSEPVTLFIKCVRCTLPFRQAKAVPYLSRKYGQQQKID
jgi:hypothetical protein